jgi:PncC family amidohydrolase
MGELTPEQQALVEALAGALRARDLRVVSAESCTGGLIAAACTSVAGSSRWFERGFVTYSNEAKIRELGVLASTLEKYGAVSAAVAGEMAVGARKRAGADWAVSVTGIAGPGGGTAGKPVGLVYLGVAGEGGVETIEKKLVPDRKTFKAMASQVALDLLRRKLLPHLSKTTEV